MDCLNRIQRLASITIALSLIACYDVDVAPRDRTPQKLAAYFSELPVPESATVLYFKDDFADGPVGRGQGVVSITLRLDSASFEATMAEASKSARFRPVSSFPIASKVASLLNAPKGIYFLEGDYWLSHDLIVLNPERRTLDVSSARLSGLP